MPELIGKSVQDALNILKEQGVEGQVRITSAPMRDGKETRKEGELRVIDVKQDVLIAAYFQTEVRAEKRP